MSNIDFSGLTLSELCVDFTARLYFTAEHFVRIEGSFTLDAQGKSLYLTPDTDRPEAFETMYSLVGKRVSTSRISDNGSLSLEFEDGSQIVVEPDKEYEAWTATGPDGLVIVCMAGGELAIWSGIAPIADGEFPAGG
ncbi:MULTISPECIES: DUF6188 family protein [unclassified Mycobacterium]|uniref:DUF6188 family protein n=1 Tax=unclassified Mycobacterium TaxID=2642494 RepID=UPI00048F90D6|nr:MULTISPECIES: DUF6188 family protein [unclassified Mycobacterium]SEA74320.1 hypothetical protein SAMN04488580_104169 [Mycobacterium sp. 283mftsu]